MDRGRKARPPGGKTGGRRARSNSTRPNSSSSAFICTVTADCVRLTERDAAAKEPLSAMAKKVRRSRIDTIISIKFQGYAQHISISSSRKQAEHGRQRQQEEARPRVCNRRGYVVLAGDAGIRGAALSKGEALQYCNEGYRAEGDSVAFGCFCAGRKFA